MYISAQSTSKSHSQQEMAKWLLYPNINVKKTSHGSSIYSKQAHNHTHHLNFYSRRKAKMHHLTQQPQLEGFHSPCFFVSHCTVCSSFCCQNLHGDSVLPCTKLTSVFSAVHFKPSAFSPIWWAPGNSAADWTSYHG